MATVKTQPVTAVAAKGGSFLTEERKPEDVFTPEDLTEEHRQTAKTAVEFTLKEVMPVADQIEAKNFEITRSLLRKTGDLGLMAVDIPEAYGGLEMDKVTSALIAESITKLGSFSVAFSVAPLARSARTISPERHPESAISPSEHSARISLSMRGL